MITATAALTEDISQNITAPEMSQRQNQWNAGTDALQGYARRLSSHHLECPALKRLSRCLWKLPKMYCCRCNRNLIFLANAQACPHWIRRSTFNFLISSGISQAPKHDPA